MKNLAIPDGTKVLLICEGPGDAAVLGALCRRRQAVPAFHAVPIEGKPRLRDDLRIIKQHKNFPALRAFAVLLDADDSAQRPRAKISAAGQTLAAINGALRDFFAAGENFLRHGEVKPLPGGMAAGAFVLPDGESDGALEKLLLESARTSRPSIMKCVDEFRECVHQAADAAARKEAKKAAQALLSGLPEYCEDLNVAIKKNLVDLDAPAFDNLCAFLQKLAAA